MICEARPAEVRTASPGASPIAGVWQKVYSCERATGVYEDRCRRGDRDVFQLWITVSGDRICIDHLATGRLGNRVDQTQTLEPSMNGTADGASATVRFVSAWEGTGTASLRVQGNTLYWKVDTKDQGESWIPDEAVLSRAPAGAHGRMPACRR